MIQNIIAWLCFTLVVIVLYYLVIMLIWVLVDHFI